MADVLRIVELSPGGRPIEVLNLETIQDGLSAVYLKERDSFKFTPAPPKPVSTSQARRYAGSRQVGETHPENASISARWLIRGPSKDQALTNIEAMLDACDHELPGRMIEFRPDGAAASRSTFFEARGTATYDPDWKWAQWNGAASMWAQINFPVAPLPRLHRMDVSDPFDVDSLSDYFFDSCSTSILTVGGDQLAPNGSLTTERAAIHTARGYALLEGLAYLTFTVGTTVTNFKAGVRLRRSAANTFVECYVDDNGTNTRLRVDVVIGGTRTNRYTANMGSRLVAGGTYAIRGRIVGQTVRAELITVVPLMTPLVLSGAGTESTPYTLTSGEQSSLPAGYAGWSWIPQHAGARLEEFDWEPYTWRAISLPEHLQPLDAIPGSAPALADLVTTLSPMPGMTGGGAAAVFALFGWTRTPGPWNVHTKGDYETEAAIGVGGAITNMCAAGASSVTKVSTVAKFGVSSVEVVVGATNNAGPTGGVYGRFKAGVTYRIECWVQAASSTTQMRVKLGYPPANDVAQGTLTALTSSWQKLTVDWTPTADREYLQWGVYTGAATATTFRIDGATIWRVDQGTPGVRQMEGKGAQPPFGIIPAESAHTISGGWTVQTNANYRNGLGVINLAVSGATTHVLEWMVDPSLVAADPFTMQELDVELWARIGMDHTIVGPVALASLRPEVADYGAERFTAEWSAYGKVLVRNTGAGAVRLYRLGRLSFVVDPRNPTRWRLRLAMITQAGSSGGIGVDELYLVPSGQRAASPTGRLLDSQYPKFVNVITETTKTIRSDLRGEISDPPGPNYPDAGLSGAPIEIPDGRTDFIVLTSSRPPDEPSVTGGVTDELAQPATVHLSVTPRARFVDGG